MNPQKFITLTFLPYTIIMNEPLETVNKINKHNNGPICLLHVIFMNNVCMFICKCGCVLITIGSIQDIPPLHEYHFVFSVYIL